jgi:intein-encoded DNA endonuclease-like protein
MLASDKDFVERFAQAIKTILGPNKKHKKAFHVTPQGPHYRFAVHAKPLAQFLGQDVRKLDDLISPYAADFLQGFFDAEGSIHWSQDIRGGYVLGAPCIQVYNTNLDLLNYVQEKCVSLGIPTSRIKLHTRHGTTHNVINGRPVIQRKDMYMITMDSIECVIRFYERINFSIIRKATTLEHLIERWVSERKRLHVSMVVRMPDHAPGVYRLVKP